MKMTKWMLGAICGLLTVSAFAGFVDERRPQEPVEARPATVVPATAAAVPAAPQAPVVRYEVTAQDKTLREVLQRWAGATGWAHAPQHWAVAEDYSVAGMAGPELFGSDFKAAVRILISSTELTSRPAQPCFYGNNVVRVIPRAAICDPAAQ